MGREISQKTGWALVACQFTFFAAYLIVPAWSPGPSPAWGWRTPGLLLATAGLALSLAGAWVIRRHLTPLPHPPDRAQLVTTGPFALARHPIYGGIVLGALGWAVWRWDALRAVLALALGVFLLVKIKLEEALLARRFPEDYPPYATRVKRMIPWLI